MVVGVLKEQAVHPCLSQMEERGQGQGWMRPASALQQGLQTAQRHLVMVETSEEEHRRAVNGVRRGDIDC